MIATITLGLLGGITVTLRPQAEVTGTEFTLGAIASVSGADEDAVARVSGFSLGYAPAPGYSRLFVRQRLAAQLARGFADLEIAVEGQTTCRVLPSVQTVEARRISFEAEGVLREVFAVTDVHLEPSGQVADLVVPRAGQRLELRARLREHTPRPGAWSVPVEILIDGQVYRTVWTSWVAELWERRQVLRRDVAGGEVLQASDFETRRVRVGTGRERNALSPIAFGHAIARRDLSVGSVVTARDVERMTVVHRGDHLSLEVRRGQVTVRAVAIAQQDGRVGDRVHVICERTGKEISAVVVSRELVELRIR